MKSLITLALFSAFLPYFASAQLRDGLQFGLSGGYRSFSLHDINTQYTALGFGSSPYKGTPVVSALIHYSPWRKKKLSFKLQYDWMPSAERSSRFSIQNVDSFNNAGPHYFYDSTANKLTGYTKVMTVTLGLYSRFAFRKLLVCPGAGFSFSTFSMGDNQWYQEFSNIDHGPITAHHPKYNSEKLNKGSGLGGFAELLCRYKIARRLYAQAGITCHLVSFAARDPWGNKIMLGTGIIGTSSIGINYNRYLQVQLSGLQESVGLVYTIF